MYAIRMGLPEMKALWDDLSQRAKTDDLSKDEKQFFGTPGELLLDVRRIGDPGPGKNPFRVAHATSLQEHLCPVITKVRQAASN